MKILTYFNIKGGIGKSTLTILTAYKLNKEGKKVLVIDGDLQANLTQFMYKINHQDKTLVNAIEENTTAEELIIKSPNPEYPDLDLIPADIELCILAEHMAVKEDKHLIMAKWFKNNIETFKKYDYIFIDLSPSIDLLNRNLLYICDSIVIPVNHGDLASLRGAELFNQLRMSELSELGIEDTAKKAVLINNHKSSKRKMLELFDKQLEQYQFLNSHLLSTKISESTTIQQAAVLKKGISDLIGAYKNKKIEQQVNSLIEELKSKEII